MGSGNNNRKNNDVPYIRRPLKIGMSVLATSGVNADIGGTATTICIPSFEQKVIKSMLTRPQLKVYLQKNGEKYSIMIAGNSIGELNKKYSTMVTICGDMGVKYSGEIIEKKNGSYARFDRISR